MTSLTRASLKNRLLVALITAAVAVFGLFSMSALKQELMPSMTAPMAFIMIEAEGLAPEEMARTVTEPAERALQAVAGVKNVASTTSSGSAQIQLDWAFGGDDDETLRAVRGAIDSLKPLLPNGAEAQVFSGGTDGIPAMMISAASTRGDGGSSQGADAASAEGGAVSAPTTDGDTAATDTAAAPDTSGTAADGTAAETPADASTDATTSTSTSDFGEALAQTALPALQGVNGVQQVELSGREDQRVMIDLRPADVTRLKVEPASIQLVLQSYGASLPAGQAASADEGEGKLSVTVGQSIASIEEIGALPITTQDGVVRISDFADVHLESAPTGSVSRVNGKPALMLQIMPAQGANVVDISHGVNAELERLAPIMHAEFVTIFDQAPYIEQSIHDLSVEGGLGLLFAVLVILAFLGSWRSTIIAAVSIPLSLLITLVGLWWSGNTLNILTLGALTIAIGRVVDDSIVVIENISRRRGTGPLTVEGVVASVRQVAGAITASTLTTVAVFVPIALVSGIAGQLFRPFAITVTIALLASLVVALTVVPVLAYWFMQKVPAKTAHVADTENNDESRGSTSAEEQLALSQSEPVSAQAALTSQNSSDAAPALSTAHEPQSVAAEQSLQATAAAATTVAITTAAAPGVAPGVAATTAPEHTAAPDPSAAPTDGDDLHEIHTAPDRLQRTLMPALGATRRHPVITLVTAGAILLATFAMSSFIRTDFLGSSGAETLQLVQTPPKGAGADLIAAAQPVERALADTEGVRDVLTSIPLAIAGSATTITYDVMLDEGVDALEIGDKIEKRLERVRDTGEVKLLTQDAFVGGAGGGGIELKIRGNDPNALRKASDLLEAELKSSDGVRSVRSELAGEQPVVRVQLDELQAAKLGFDPGSVAQAIHAALEGQHIGQVMLDGRDRSIVVRTPGTEQSAESLGSLMLPVTPQQTAEARKLAGDELTRQAEAKAESARNEAASELNSQLWQASQQRAELISQISAITAQLQAISQAPIVPGPPLSPEEDAMARAQQERAEQIAGLQAALGGAQAGIEGLDAQISGLRDAQGQAATMLAEQQQAEEAQKAALEAPGTPVPLSAIATVTEELTAPVITRANGERQVVLTVTPATGSLDAANTAVQHAIDTVQLPAGVSFELGGVSAEQDEAFAQLGAAMLAAILLVLLVMVATFRSFRGPFVLLVSIPFAATGALLGLLLTNTALGLPAMIGLLMLIGIVVTNAIVLMDLIGRLRASGATLEEAVEHGTRLRLRPILMTAAATIFALVPMSLGLTGGGVFISKPLAIVVIGGLISSTLLTLILVPILYTLVERRYDRKRQKREDRRARRAAKRAERAERAAVRRGEQGAEGAAPAAERGAERAELAKPILGELDPPPAK